MENDFSKKVKTLTKVSENKNKTCIAWTYLKKEGKKQQRLFLNHESKTEIQETNKTVKEAET